MPSVGSSSSSSRGRVISARAMASCWRWPPESRPARRPSRPRSAGNRSSASAIAALPSRAGRRRQLEVLRRGQVREATAGPAARRPCRARTRSCGAQPGDVLAVEQHRAAARLEQARPPPAAACSCRRRCGPCTAATPSSGTSTRDAVQHDAAAVADVDVVDLQHHASASGTCPPPRGVAAAAVPEVDLLHLRVGLHLGDRALAEHLAGVQHGDAAGEAAQEVHVVLDDHHRPVLG